MFIIYFFWLFGVLFLLLLLFCDNGSHTHIHTPSPVFFAQGLAGFLTKRLGKEEEEGRHRRSLLDLNEEGHCRYYPH